MKVLRPDCEFGEHSWCRIAEVVVENVVIVKARRCDCPCHQGAPRAGFVGRPDLPPILAEPR